MNTELLNAVHSAALDTVCGAVASRGSAALMGVAEGQAAFLAALIAQRTGKRVLIVAQNELKGARLGEDLTQLLGADAAYLPGGQIDLTRGAASQEMRWRRLETLEKCGTLRVLAAPVEALMQRMGDPRTFFAARVILKPGDRYDPAALIDHLTHAGYERVDMVEGKGQCAMRGAILDVYPPESTTALRIEFFDDEVDSIRAFDCISQRSAEHLPACAVGAACETILPPEDAAEAAERMRRALRAAKPGEARETNLFDDLPPLPDEEDDLAAAFDTQILPRVQKRADDARRREEIGKRIGWLMEDADRVAQGLTFRRIRAWLPVLASKTYLLTDWFAADCVIFVQPDQLRDRCAERAGGFQEDLASAMERGEAVREQQELLAGWDEIRDAACRGRAFVTFSDFLRSLGGIRPEAAADADAQGVLSYGGKLRDLAADLRTWASAGIAAVVLSGGVSRGKRLAENLIELGVQAVFTEDDAAPVPGGCVILPFTQSAGFLWREADLAVVSDADVFGSSYRRSGAKKNTGEKIAAFTDLKVGDYVVHEDHGIAVYQGTTRIVSDGTGRDYLVLQYAGADKLYVPVEQLERVQKYIGNPNDPPKLNMIGGGEWTKQTGKVREGLKKLAFDLVRLYAERSQATGHAFAKDTPWQKEFEDRFPYELTPDQKQSVKEIAADMESDRNMDRLLCGDVGYGKTEVSLRAAFKAIMDGKQVAILAPTTILVQQHWNTVQKRFAGFPVRTEMLSRFRSAKQAKQVLKDLEDGSLDLIVGTHSLLAKNVKFHDLGLLIIDEEQRFGVAHKEAIKNLKKQVDVLTLSATPIPRTLHMSMVGIRDMSVLETPPQDRMPVQTHVSDYSDALIRDAILRELSRGGQVYFLYNRVQSIGKFYDRLKQLVPEARIGVAHGQMKEHALEDVMMDFYGGSYDVLLCTTIIESGLDVPTANTLIVFDADMFGLSQLYQLRGRVGRSSVQAYAYFTVRQDRMLSETAQQRLAAIREFTEFGSGFRIAMRDLEIRGAGNILGPEQHGHLSAVGYDMYCKLMEETLNEARGIVTAKPLETRVDLHVNAFLPGEYITSEQQRMEMYKRIGDIVTRSDRMDAEDELIDRFGNLPEPVNALLDIAQMRGLANRLGAAACMHRGDRMVFRIDARYAPDPALLLPSLGEADARFGVTRQNGSDAVTLKVIGMNDRDSLREGVKALERLIEIMETKREAAEQAAKAKVAAEDAPEQQHLSV